MNAGQLENEKVVLRKFTQADAPIVRTLAGDFAVADTTLRIPHPYPQGVAETWIATHEGLFRDGTGAIFAITAQPENTLAGCIGIEINRAHNHGEIGYWIGRPFWGQGYCTLALRIFLAFCFSQLGLHRVYAHHFARNPASGRVLAKAGLRPEGVLREHILKSGRYQDVIYFGLLQSEYERAAH